MFAALCRTSSRRVPGLDLAGSCGALRGRSGLGTDLRLEVLPGTGVLTRSAERIVAEEGAGSGRGIQRRLLVTAGWEQVSGQDDVARMRFQNEPHALEGDELQRSYGAGREMNDEAGAGVHLCDDE